MLFGCPGPQVKSSTNVNYHLKREVPIVVDEIARDNICDPYKLGDKCEEIVDTIRKELLPEDVGQEKDSPPYLKANAFIASLDQRVNSKQAVLSPFFEMPENVQLKVIEHLLSKKEPEDYGNVLAQLYSKQRNDPFDRKRDLHLAISSSLDSNSPGDRIEDIKVFLYLVTEDNNKHAVFSDVSKIGTERKLTKLGEIHNEYTNRSKLSGEIPFSESIGSPGFEYESTFNKKVEREISKELAERSYELGLLDGRALLIKQRAPLFQTDLTGTIFIEPWIKVYNEPAKISIFSASDLDRKQGDVKNGVWKVTPKYFLNSGSVQGFAAWAITVRSIQNEAGNKTTLEDDDHVVPVIFSGLQKITFWENPEEIYLLRAKVSNKDNKYCESNVEKGIVPLFFSPENSNVPQLVAFSNPDEAFKFLLKLGNRKFNNVKTKSQEYKKFGLLISDGPQQKLDSNMAKIEFVVYRVEPEDFPIKRCGNKEAS